MAKKFDFEGARRAGYSDQEISSHLGELNPDFDVQSAVQSGYSPEEINVYLSEQRQPSRIKSLLSAGTKGLIRGASNVNPFLPRGPVPPQLQERIFEEALPSQEKPAERFVERAGELIPAAALGPEGLGAKAAQLGAATLAGHVAEQTGIGPTGQMIGEIVGFTFPGLAKSLGLKAISGLKKGVKAGAGEAAARLTRIKPQQINEAVRTSAERLGVLEDVPLSSQVKNPIIQGTETKLMQSMAGGPIQKKLERLSGKLGETYREATQSLSKREGMLPSVISEEAANVLKGIEEGSENAYRSLYSQASKALPESAHTSPKLGGAIHRVIDSTINKLKSALGTPSKDALLNRLTRLKDAWSSTPQLRSGEIPIKELETLKQDLNQVIKYETKGGVDKLLSQLQGVTKEAIQSYGREFNQPYLNRFNQAERLFAENAKIFRKNPMMKSLVKGERPEQIFGRMNTVKGINDIEKVFNKTPEGKETIDALKRYKLEDLLNKKILDKNGEISFGKAAGMFKDPKTRDLALKLLGPEQYKKLKDLSVVASGIEEGFKKFLNTSRTATTAADMALLGALPVKAVEQLFKGNVMGALKTTAVILGPNQLARLMSNPEFVEAAIQAGKAGKGSNAQSFLSKMQRVAQFTSAELLKDFSTEAEAEQP